MENDFPIIETLTPETPAAPAPAAAAVLLPAVVSLKTAALAQFSVTESTLIALAERYKDVAYDVAVPRHMTAAKLARQEIRQHRYTVQRVKKATLAELNDLKRTVGAKAERLIAMIEPIEAGVHCQIKAHEDKLAAENAERERIDAERRAKHEANIAAIRAYFTRCSGLPADRVAKGIEFLANTDLAAASWEEFHERALIAQAETLAAMRALHADLLQRAADEAQRAENARVAAEQAERQRQLDAQAAKLKRQADELAAREKAEQDRAAADAFAELEKAKRAESVPPQLLEALAASVAAIVAGDLIDRAQNTPESSPVGGPTGAEQPAAAGLASAPPVGSPPHLAAPINLSTINARLGFIVTSALLVRLGFTGTKSPRGNALLYPAADWAPICKALAKYVTAMEKLA